jgi:cystathionine beta-lyase/cystathionine gamma-synthase
MFNDILPRFGVTTSYIDGRDIENFERAILPHTSLIYLESPNSWDYAIQDLKAVAELAKAENIVTIIDNSYCTPIYQKPIDFGIDLTLQSATKYIGGHSDTVAGVLSGSKAMIERIFNSEYMNIGSGISPFNAWLLIRGLRTLSMRLERITQTTQQVVQYLKQHDKVESVLFPFDESFPQYALAKQQMQGACGLLTFIIKADNVQQVEKFCESLQHILMAVSWGGHESLIIPKCSGIPSKNFNAENKEHRMLRLYVGLEEADYIINDLEKAFDKMN